MTVDFRYAADDEYPRLSAFIDEHWAKNHIYVRDPKLFNWTFKRPGLWPAGSYSVAVAEEAGELIGMLGGIPFEFNAHGARRPAAWIVNYAVRADHRRGAAAFKLLSMFRNPSFPVVIASGLNPATVVIYKVLRGQVLPEMPRHFFVLPNAVERTKDLLRLAHPDWDDLRAADVVRAFAVPRVDDSDVRISTALPPDWDRDNWEPIAATTVGAVRDEAYLRWRYLEHPVFDYRFIVIEDGARQGLVVWRCETIRRDTPEGRVDVDRLGRVVEFLPASRENGRKLLSALTADLIRSDAIGADFYGYNGEIRSILSDNAFHSVQVHPGGGDIPSRFQPLDAGGGGILNAMFADPGLPGCTTECDCPWYWTKSDSDQDRPN